MVCAGLFGSEFCYGASNGVSFYEPMFLKRLVNGKLDQMFWPSDCKFVNNGVSIDPSLRSLEANEDIELRDAGPGDA
jgi:hypothetical protein